MEDTVQVPKTLLVFRAGELCLAVDVRHVREVVRAVPVTAPLANGCGTLGMIILRGESTAVIDLTALLGLPDGQPNRRARMIAVRHGGTTVCLLVDQVDGLCDVAEDDLVPPPPIIAGASADWLDYVTHRPTGELVGVINVEGALSRASLTGVEASTTRV